MHATIRTSPLLLLLTVIAALALPAAAARADHLAATVTGVVDNGSAFEGAFRVNRFRSTRLGVIASGLLVGTVTDGNGDITDVLSLRVNIPVADIRSASANPGSGNCDFLTFAMDPIDLPQIDFTLQTDAFNMSLSRESAGVIGSQFCTIADGFDTGRFTQIVSSLNNILDVLARR